MSISVEIDLLKIIRNIKCSNIKYNLSKITAFENKESQLTKIYKFSYINLKKFIIFLLKNDILDQYFLSS